MPKTSPKAAPKPVAAKAPAKGDHVFLVDGSSYIFRAYHALPPLNRKSDGLQVNAVLGFCNMLWKLLRDMPPDNRPTHLAIVFDKSEITFRNKLYPDYKAHRPPAPDDLIPQFALIREAVRAFDLPCLEQGGFEADDLIATYAREAGERGATTTIVSSDKDLMQLVTDKVTMYDTMKDRRIGIAEVIEKFGVPPEKVVEVQALAGDSTDNVPGVPGIGIKTAAQLIVEYGDLETLLERACEIKQPKRREALIENAEKARISRQLVLLDDKVEARRAARRTRGARARRAQADRVPEGDGILHPDPPRRRIFADRSGGRGGGCGEQERGERPVGRLPPVRRPRACRQATCLAIAERPRPALRRKRERRAHRRGEPAGDRQDKPTSLKGTPQALAAARAEEARKTRIDRSKYQTIRSLDELKAWIARVHDVGHFAIEAKANSIDPMQAEICGIALALGAQRRLLRPARPQAIRRRRRACSPPASRRTRSGRPTRWTRCGRCWSRAGILKIGFNIKFSAVMLAQHGITLRNHDDAQLMSYALDAGRNAARARRAGRALARPCHHQPWRTDRQRQGQARLRPGRDRQGHGLFGRGRRRDPAAVARAEAAAGRRAHDRGL